MKLLHVWLFCSTCTSIFQHDAAVASGYNQNRTMKPVKTSPEQDIHVITFLLSHLFW